MIDPLTRNNAISRDSLILIHDSHPQGQRFVGTSYQFYIDYYGLVKVQ